MVRANRGRAAAAPSAIHEHREAIRKRSDGDADVRLGLFKVAPGAPRPLAVFDHLRDEVEGEVEGREGLVIRHLQRLGVDECAERARQKLGDVVLAREGELERGVVDGVADLADRDAARERELPARRELEDVRQRRRAAVNASAGGARRRVRAGRGTWTQAGDGPVCRTWGRGRPWAGCSAASRGTRPRWCLGARTERPRPGPRPTPIRSLGSTGTVGRCRGGLGTRNRRPDAERAT